MARKADPQKKERIIAAALTAFAQKGYAGTRIIEVAQAAGIGKGTIYEYFRSKEALFFAALEHLLAGTEGQMKALAETTDGSVADRLMILADQVIRAAADRARTGKLRPEDMAPAAVTLSNLGGLGVDRFNALLFPPQAVILSAGTIRMRPVATGDGALKAALTCEVGLTVDHRVADGADGARFLDTFAHLVEDPA